MALAEFVIGLEQRHFTKEIANYNEEGAVVDKDIVEEEIPSIIHTIAAEVYSSTAITLSCTVFVVFLPSLLSPPALSDIENYYCYLFFPCR